MSTRKKVHTFVRVKPTDDFAHEMIKYGDDNKVSGMCLLSPAWSSLSHLAAVGPCFQTAFKDQDRIDKSSDGVQTSNKSKPLPLSHFW